MIVKNNRKVLTVLLQIFLIVFSSFNIIILNPKIVEAQEQKVCCAETIGGEHCTYIEQSQCKPGALQAATTCDKTSFCKLGCGFDQDSGKCFRNLPRFTCQQTGNCTWADSATCDIPQCQRGCCILSNQCSFTTQLECKRTTSQFESVNMTFKEEITDELTCINQCRSFERGACVYPDGSCKFTTRDQCDQQTGSQVNVTGPLVGFHPDKLCSNPTLNTECAPQQRTGCLPDREEVYWFDSCGNPENIYSSDKPASYNNGFVLGKDQSCNPSNANVNSPSCGNCNYVLGSACALADRGVNPVYGEYACKDLSCDLDDITVSPTSPASNSERKLGESWCAYDGVPGFGRDLVGSRHYRRLCINGVELTESCKDFREEICVQGIQGQLPLPTQEAFAVRQENYIEAACRSNRFKSCVDIKNQFDCENIQARDCVWFGERKNTETDARRNKNGKCVPLVSPGLKFWPEESTGATPSSDATAICEKGNQECKVIFERGGLGSRWECVGNCECLQKSYLQSANNYCKALGDCGAWYNIAGRFTTGGLEENSRYDLTASDVESFDELISPAKGKGEYDNKFGEFFKRSWVPLGTIALLGTLAELGGATFGAGLLGGVSVIGKVGGTWIGSNVLGLENVKVVNFQQATTSAFGADLVFTQGPAIAASQLQAGQFVTAEGLKTAFSQITDQTISTYVQQGLLKDVGNGIYQLTETGANAAHSLTGSVSTVTFSTTLATIFTVVSIATIIWTVYNLLDVLLAKTKTETINIKCLPWTAPTGGDDCEKCDAEGKECSEYGCKSLGQTCGLVNAGTREEKCINLHPNDVTSPIIRADPAALRRGLTLTEVPGEGFTVNQQIEPFTPVTLGITTNEFSQCKYSIDRGKPFDEMTSYFGDSIYRKNHTITFSLPSALAEDSVLRLTNGGRYTAYVRCQDGNGNKNNRDYYIKFAIKPGPDLTPPVIELTSISNNAYVPANVTSTPLVAYLNEPSTCKWDDIDTDYNAMQNSFSCTTNAEPGNSEFYGLYACSTVLDGIQNNQINTYYFKCKDQPNNPDESRRNVNSESYIFRLRGTQPLEITSVIPTGGITLYDPSPILRVTTTRGAQGGIAICGYNFFDPSPLNAIEFLRTNSTVHEQQFTNMTAGNYNVFINCFDAGGNIASTTTQFNVAVDTIAPVIAQLYTEGNILILITNEPTTCEYSTTGSFAFGSGIQMTGLNQERHEASLDSNIYYIKCNDQFNNVGSYTIYI